MGTSIQTASPVLPGFYQRQLEVSRGKESGAESNPPDPRGSYLAGLGCQLTQLLSGKALAGLFVAGLCASVRAATQTGQALKAMLILSFLEISHL